MAIGSAIYWVIAILYLVVTPIYVATTRLPYENPVLYYYYYEAFWIALFFSMFLVLSLNIAYAIAKFTQMRKR